LPSPDSALFQRRTTSEAEQFFATDDFESEWIQSGAAYREKHLLEGMVRTCDMGLEDDRMESDEVTLPYLQKANGRGFLTLLKHFMLDDASFIPSEPIFHSQSSLGLRDGEEIQKIRWRKGMASIHREYPK
jgi:hypothetical protein